MSGVPRSGVSQPIMATAARYGGFWIRFVAAILDAILVQVVVVPFGALMGGAIGSNPTCPFPYLDSVDCPIKH